LSKFKKRKTKYRKFNKIQNRTSEVLTMQVQIPKKQLSDALSSLERVVPSRSSNAALTQLKVSSTERGLALSGTNLEIDIEILVEAQINDGTDFVVPAHLFAQITKALPGELVELHLTGSELTVASGGATFKLQTGELGAYPELSFPTHRLPKSFALFFVECRWNSRRNVRVWWQRTASDWHTATSLPRAPRKLANW
jgi:DNA polymerase III beta subunit, N-terminal domain